MKPRKEIFLAIFIGSIIALLIVGGIMRARKAFKDIKPKLADTFSLYSSPSPVATSNLFLDLKTEDNQVVSEPKLKLVGQTLPGTFLAITSEKNDFLLTPNELGDFSQEITLIKGANAITVTVFKKDGEKLEKKLSIVYTTVEL